MRAWRVVALAILQVITLACPPVTDGAGHYAQISWQAGAGNPVTVVTRVYKQSPGTGFVLAQTTSALSWKDTSVKMNLTYKYRMTSFDTVSGKESVPSKTATCVIGIPTCTVN